VQGVTQLCFGLSYASALVLEVVQQISPRPVQRFVALLFGVAGLLAHSIFLLLRQPTPADPGGSFLLLAWVLAVFYVYGAAHATERPWAVFVLPVILGLVGISVAIAVEPEGADAVAAWLSGERAWGLIHGSLLLAAFVGVCVGFLASVMYLIQARRLRNKRDPRGGMRLLSLERLETMNRRAVNWAFPLLTAGLLLGALLMARNAADLEDWAALKVLSTTGLWLTFGVLLYLRYGAHLPGRRLAAFTLVAFGVMLLSLAASHPPIVSGDPR
jgi:ABC-type transport system involved in cytochrome c biogenesis permease subunit